MLFPRLTPVLVLLTTAQLLAQRGDNPQEAQPGVPEHIKVPPAPTLTAEEALKTLKVAPGFRIEIAAADPLVGDPVAMTFGPDGRIWVVEMRGFMPNADGQSEDAKVGSVAVLEDTDGDGRADKRTTFIDGLVLPRALALVGDGLLVAEPPYLWFCRDTNGDGVADEKTEVFSDYGGTSNPEHTANGLMWALDNWIYNVNHPQRFRYLGNGKFTNESTPSRGQWGLTQDDTGRIYHNSNRDPLRADLVPAAYLRRNPYFIGAAGSNVRLASPDLPVWPGRVTTGVNRGYKTLNAEGKITAVTAACAPLIYRSSLFPAEFHGNAFIAEPAGNLVKRLILTEADGTVTAGNAYENSEFLTSTDERFRPVNTANGPDGALYLVDMYRGIIQHRIYVTTFLRKQIDERGLAEGLGMGRIYRIVPETAAGQPKAKFNLTTESSVQLVDRLSSVDSWWRDTAQRLLVERRDPAAVAPLRALARSGSPLARLHALWTLDGSEQLDRDTVLAALDDVDARVVTAAIRLSERWLSGKGDAALFKRVSSFVERPEPAVRLQAALSLGESRDPLAVAVLGDLARRHGNQPYLADAIISGLADRELDFISYVIAHDDSERTAPALTLAASALFKSADAARITRLLALLEPAAAVPAWVRPAILDGLERFLPKTPDGKLVAGVIAVEPRPLLLLAVRGDSPEAKQAARLSGLLKWPGKPGLDQESSAVSARLTPEQKVLFEKGRTLFAAICAGCHQPNGEGLAGLAPQLIYSRFVLGSEGALARIVLNGKEKEGLVMPPLRALDDESLAATLTYIRQSWGHNAPPVSPGTIAKVRAEVGNREEPWSEEELQGIP